VTRARAWIAACRPATLAAAVVPVAVGSACARAAGGFRLGPALAALAGAVAIQIGTNLANDVFDHRRGADGPDRLGPTRVVAAGLLSARAVLRAMVLAFAVATAAGLYLTAVAGPAVVIIGILSIAAGVLYTAGPWPLAYLGLGDPFVLAFFGLVAVAGTAFVQMGTVPPHAWACGLAVGAIATGILVVNNLRDRAGDARAGKRTLAVRLGRRAAVAEYWLLLAAAYAAPAVLGARGALPLLSLPLALWLARAAAVRDGRDLNGVLAGTARLMVAHGALLTVAVAS
jgi:1,4-dihydroxy-2-naphthoate polyprenyltransferase